MSLKWPKSGPNWATAYSVPGIPWVTGSVSVSGSQIQKLALPFVSKYFTVKNTGANLLRVGFAPSGVTGSNYFTLETSASQDFKIRVRDVYLHSPFGTTFDVVAGLTQISRNEFPELTVINPPPTGSVFIKGIG